MKKLLGCFLGLMLLFPVSVLAIPSLGVAPGAPGTGGVYFGPTPPAGSYFWTFADTFVGGTDGFAMPASGEDLSIWYGTNSGPLTSTELDVDIWLLSTQGAFTFDTLSTATVVDFSAASYKDPIWGVNLGNASDWDDLNDGEFGGIGKDFKVLTDSITYTGNFEAGDWMFAVADKNGNGQFDNGIDSFSPKTTSATAPEPATMLLLGSGLLGFGVFGRKRFKK